MDRVAESVARSHLHRYSTKSTCVTTVPEGKPAPDTCPGEVGRMAVAGPSNLSDVRFLTVAEVATLMRVSKMTVYRLVHSGELNAVRVGRSFRVPERAVHEYLRDAFTDTA
ncbi:hypothetical protein GCM10009539_15370 [Cryptosporangium japonicum]|uniref:Helix-turn-helix domain-containing protein n=2 Tax=Cryptosporangiaceae TaxID=622454 RepID=A0ABN0TUX6_9ACTN